MDLGSSNNNVKRRNEAKKSLLKTLERRCSTAEKLFNLDKTSQDGLILLRHLSEQKRRTVGRI